jgi:hypothetical protein
MKKFFFLLCLVLLPSFKAKAEPLTYLVNLYHAGGDLSVNDPTKWDLRKVSFVLNYDQLSGIGRDELGVYAMNFHDVSYVFTHETFVGGTVLSASAGTSNVAFWRDGVSLPFFTVYNTWTPFDIHLDVPPLIEGSYRNGAIPEQWFTVTAIGGQTPEPSSLLLLGSGALGLIGVFRRRLANV